MSRTRSNGSQARRGHREVLCPHIQPTAKRRTNDSDKRHLDCSRDNGQRGNSLFVGQAFRGSRAPELEVLRIAGSLICAGDNRNRPRGDQTGGSRLSRLSKKEFFFSTLKRRDAPRIELAYGDFGLRPRGICFPQSVLVLQTQHQRSNTVHLRFPGEQSHEYSGGCEARQSRKRRGLGSQA